jgi:hypothetical protein
MTTKKASPSSDDGNASGPVPLACTNCRERHLKCDGSQPTCSRCEEGQHTCRYVRSRRGLVSSRKRRASSASTSQPPREHSENYASRDTTGALDLSFLDSSLNIEVAPSPSDHHESSVSSKSMTSVDSLSKHQAGRSQPSNVMLNPLRTSEHLLPLQSAPAVRSNSPSQHTDRLRELYYLYFHDAHPILVPEAYYSAQPRSSIEPCIIAVMDYIGAQYSSVKDMEYLQTVLEQSLYTIAQPKTGHRVQALLLYAIAQHSQDRTHQACKTLDEAIDLALQLGMDSASFAQVHGQGSNTLQESWRRTWWELYAPSL